MICKNSTIFILELLQEPSPLKVIAFLSIFFYVKTSYTTFRSYRLAVKILERYLIRVTLDTYYIIKKRGEFHDSYIWNSIGPIRVVFF